MAINRTSIFDTVRTMLGRGFRDGEVAALDKAIDAAGIPEIALRPDAPSLPETGGAPSATSAAGLALIMEFESCAEDVGGGRYQAYPDPGSGGKPWTIGWGSTTDFDGRPIAPGTIWTKAQCDQRKAQDMRRFETGVKKLLGSALAATSQPQFDALVSFTYNCGEGNFAQSTLLRMHKAGNFAGAAGQFARWNRAQGRVMRGLTRRRAAEAKLYRSGM